MQFQIGDMVVYGIHGVCKITGVEKRAMDRKIVEYYVLMPTQQSDARFYVPMHNPAAMGKLRKVLSKQELMELLQSEEIRTASWIANESARKDKYRVLITQADCVQLIRMIRALHFHKQAQQAAGKKLHLCDENFMKDAERVIRSEVSAVMEIPPESVGEFIRSKIDE